MTSTSPERVLRGLAADALSSAPLRVAFTPHRNVPERVLAEARGAARAEGYAAGWAQGRRAAAERAEAEATRTAVAAAAAEAQRAAAATQALTALAAAANRLDQRTAPVLADFGELIADAALQIAEAVIGHELRTAADPARDAVRRALSGLPEDRPVTVRLNPDDHKTLGASGPTELCLSGRRVTVVADALLAPGDAIAESGATLVDARIAAAVQRVRKALAP